jgi:hypothetical protein
MLTLRVLVCVLFGSNCHQQGLPLSTTLTKCGAAAGAKYGFTVCLEVVCAITGLLASCQVCCLRPLLCVVCVPSVCLHASHRSDQHASLLAPSILSSRSLVCVCVVFSPARVPGEVGAPHLSDCASSFLTDCSAAVLP